jgi:hypothetical protein
MRVTHLQPGHDDLGAHARSQELEDERTARTPKRLSNELPLGALDVAPMADAHNCGKVTRFYGPPTDPTLDASREHDLQTQWHALAAPNRRLGYALLVVVLSVAAVWAFA